VRELGLADYYRHKDKRNAKSKEWYAKRSAKLAAAWRPADWGDKPIEWRIIGTELLSEEGTMNEELAERLDKARIVKCPYGGNWKSAIRMKACSEFLEKSAHG
jgi:hypothetical protein